MAQTVSKNEYGRRHTEDSNTFCFPEEKVMFTGDFLFRGTIGRTDFPGGNNQGMIKSLELIKEYPNDIKIYPGHGEETLLSDEKPNFDGYFNSLSKQKKRSQNEQSKSYNHMWKFEIYR